MLVAASRRPPSPFFAEQGYEATTVAEIAERAGLTKRTFFRHFSDKREVLFSGAQELERVWLEAVSVVSSKASPLAMVTAGLDPVATMFVERHEFARVRSEIIGANPELRERELIKLQNLAASIEVALRDRGVSANVATLAAQAGVTVFHVAFAAWLRNCTARFARPFWSNSDPISASARGFS